jgi:hypothetical protein
MKVPSVGFWATWEILTSTWCSTGVGTGIVSLDSLPSLVTRAVANLGAIFEIARVCIFVEKTLAGSILFLDFHHL